MSPLLIIILVFGLIVIFLGFFIVRQQTTAVIQRFGKFHSVRNSGFQLRIPFVDQIAGRINLRIQQLDVM